MEWNDKQGGRFVDDKDPAGEIRMEVNRGIFKSEFHQLVRDDK